jgi:hypothetical protein
MMDKNANEDLWAFAERCAKEHRAMRAAGLDRSMRGAAVWVLPRSILIVAAVMACASIALAGAAFGRILGWFA